MRGMHQPKPRQRPQRFAHAVVGGAASLDGHQQAHAEESQAVEEVDDDDALDLHVPYSFRPFARNAIRCIVRLCTPSFRQSQSCPAYAAETITALRARAALMAIDIALCSAFGMSGMRRRRLRWLCLRRDCSR